jgi:heme exporter protein C
MTTSQLVRVLGGLAALALLAGLVMAFAVAPREVTQGNVQRIMYVHVPAVWVAYLAFLMVFVASVVFLWTRSPRADRLAHAGAEVGVLFLGVNIATGSIWGKPTWGTWWTWDARLTSVTVVFLIYVGYLLLRRMIDDPERAARYAAILGILGAPNIYLVHVSVQWWRTLHQPPTLMKAGSATLAPIFWWAILVNFVALALLSAYFVAKRTRLLQWEQEAAA